MATANAASFTTAIIYLVCRFGFIIAPTLSMEISKSWFHGIDISRISATNLSLEAFIIGIISSAVGAWIVGYIFAVSYNAFIRK